MTESIATHGFCDPAFEPIQTAFEKGFRDGIEVGASVAVYKDGEAVVDLWAGHRDAQRTKPWLEDTVTVVTSTTKIMTNLCGAMLLDQGKLDPEAPVVEYWPEFGRHGKDKVLVKHIFAHSAGLPGFDPPIPASSLLDWQAMVDILEDQKVWWEPGTKVAYHGRTFGFLVGELVRRISGLTPGNFLRQEVTSKIDADFYIGTPAEEWERIALPIREDDAEDEFSEFGRKVMSSIIDEKLGLEWLSAELPGENGVGHARSVAQLCSIYANHGVMKGQRFLSEKTLEYILQEQSYELDLVIDMPVRRGFGLGLNSNEFVCPGEKSLHWGGMGGSIAIMDLASRTCLAYVPNNWLNAKVHDPRNEAIRLAYNALVGEA
jgi:CubicO group peptidase (beta-lactamase class C family)